MRNLVLTASLLLAAAPLPAWGVLGHQLVATAALKDLDPILAPWFAGQEKTMADHASDPDHWKSEDPFERPRHFLECEPYGGPARVPLDQGAARAMLGDDLFQDSGQVPWVILDRVQRLRQTFAAGDPGQVALAASILSHYVGDLCVPLHTTVNRHGKVTGQRGVHKRWQIGLVEQIESREPWLPEIRPAALGPDPQAAPWAWLKDSYSLVAGLLADDLAARKAEPDGGIGPEYWQAFSQSQEPHVKEQLTLAAQRTAQMIQLAWTEAGSPPSPAPGAQHPTL